MATTAAVSVAEPSQVELPLWRLYVLRAMYLLLVVGLGATIIPQILASGAIGRGVIPSLLAAVWLLALLGLRYPLQMLPILLFELAWKTIWMLAYGLPQRSIGDRPPTYTEDFFNISTGAILLLVIPWGYVWQRYIRQPAERWR